MVSGGGYSFLSAAASESASHRGRYQQPGSCPVNPGLPLTFLRPGTRPSGPGRRHPLSLPAVLPARPRSLDTAGPGTPRRLLPGSQRCAHLQTQPCLQGPRDCGLRTYVLLHPSFIKIHKIPREMKISPKALGLAFPRLFPCPQRRARHASFVYLTG